jgi:acyl dehydratase
MEPTPTLPRGRYFEEFQVGDRLRTRARTITEGDIVTFAGVSGDFNSIHTDEVYATQSGFGRRVAHGLLGLSIVSGLAVRTGILEARSGVPRSTMEVQRSRCSSATRYADLEIDEVKPFRTPGRAWSD